jgi:tetratricopeptide (TPR) repeat protein
MLRLLPVLVLFAALHSTDSSAAQKSFDEVARQAESARNADHAEGAIALYREGVRMRPSWTEGWGALGNLYYEQDRFPEAKDALTQFVGHATNPGSAWAILGLCDYETHDFDRAEEHFQKWVKAGSPGSEYLIDVVAFHWALLLTRQGHFEKALDLLSGRAKRKGESPVLVEAMGLASSRISALPEDYPPELRERVWLAGKSTFYTSRGDSARAQEYSSRLLARYGQDHNVHDLHVSQDVAARPQHGTSAQAVGDFDQLAGAAKQARADHRDDDAIRLYRQALALKPDWDEGLWYLATLSYEKENYSEACDLLRHFVVLDPQNGAGWALLGNSEFQTRQYSRALNHLQQSLVIGLGNNKKMEISVYYLTAILLTRFERFDDAMNLLFMLQAAGDTGISLVEPFGLASLRIPLLPTETPSDRKDEIRTAGAAALALQAQKYQDAEKLLSELETKYPNEPGVHFLVGAYLLGVRPADGIRELQKEIEISPSHVPARIRLAEEFIKEKQAVKGISLMHEALKIAPDDPLAHLVLGEGMMANGDTDGGIRELEIAQAGSPQMIRVHWDLLRAYTAAGRTDDASRQKSAIERLNKQNDAQ